MILERVNCSKALGKSVPKISELLPLPETPVMPTRLLSGIFTLRFFMLFMFAFLISMKFSCALFLAKFMFSLPFKYCAVRVLLFSSSL